jgi:hypothetical protein
MSVTREREDGSLTNYTKLINLYMLSCNAPFHRECHNEKISKMVKLFL